MAKPASNAQRKKWLEKYPLPGVTEFSSPKLDMTMRLLVSKEVSAHYQWLKKVQAISYEVVEEDFNSPGVLFGDGAVDCIQKRNDAIKVLRKAKQPFPQGSAQGRGHPGRREKQGQYRPGQRERSLPYAPRPGRGGRGAKKQ